MVLLASLTLVACTRDPETAICPDVSVGDIAITEIAGKQTGNDTLVPWVELYNASSSTIDFEGLKVRLRQLDGDEIDSFLIRRTLTVSAGDYVVLGMAPDGGDQDYIDYGFGPDFAASWPSAAAIDVISCDLQVDRAQWPDLPNTGTYSMGKSPPTADLNDFPTNWCTDATPNIGSAPGTPKQMNNVCP
ncbi:hypothetical protein BH11MYX2_BH11MYX2_03770 [soil metagenome]